jgi:hypothetical protein
MIRFIVVITKLKTYILMKKLLFAICMGMFTTYAYAYDPMDCVNDAVKAYPEFTNGLITRLCAAASTSEPVKCFVGISQVDKSITIGISVDLCTGTTSAKKTLECYGRAAEMDLNRGMSVRLCSGLGSAEPAKCYAKIPSVDAEITRGIAVDVCGGSLNADKTIGCYAKAARLFNRGMAVTLCGAKRKLPD